MRKSSPDRLLRCIRLLSILVALVMSASAVTAQVQGPDYSVVERVAAPRGENWPAYSETAARNGAQSTADYVSKLDGRLATGKTRTSRAPAGPRGADLELGGFGVFLVVVVLIAALLLWLKFGGSGVLLARAPVETAKGQDAPAGWNIESRDTAGTTQDLLDRLAAMQDRSAALVLLLRHCLLAAATATGTRFARSDTERRAFRRLPDRWSHHGGLETILRRTELAHYGGRPVAEDAFQNALAAGRVILDAGKMRAPSNV